uniref:Uncharacterized protein n=1 Tax=Rhizophora mucronata TaxID=61149 RepID=A0A2P2Q394_RHIMU
MFFINKYHRNNRIKGKETNSTHGTRVAKSSINVHLESNLLARIRAAKIQKQS